MNFIITTDCNKGCPYCFAREHRNSVSEENRNMTKGTFLKLLNKVPAGGTMKFIGGEPTQHKQFKEFMEEALSRNIEVVLITNLLFSDDICDFLIEKLKTHEFSFLINSTSLDVGNRIEKWSKNYKKLYNFLYKYDRESKLSCGITFEDDKPTKYYLDYIDFLLKHIKKIERLRLSLNFPGDQKNKEKFQIINNKELGNKFLELTKKSLDIGAIPSIDCIVFPCLFLNKEEFKYVSKFNQNFRTVCNSAPADIFPDSTVSYCYPIKDAINADIDKYEFITEAVDENMTKYNIIKQTITPPETCQNCSFYKVICEGPCLAFYDLSKKEIGNSKK